MINEPNLITFDESVALKRIRWILSEKEPIKMKVNWRLCFSKAQMCSKQTFNGGIQGTYTYLKRFDATSNQKNIANERDW